MWDPTYLPAYEDGTDRVFRNVGIKNSDAGELPRKKAYNIQVPSLKRYTCNMSDIKKLIHLCTRGI
jgi:hypothetical protein